MAGNRQTWVIWAMMMLDQPSQEKIAEFFTKNFSIKRNGIKKQMHLTIYHASLGIQNQSRNINRQSETYKGSVTSAEPRR
jgi:hypothetical protein